MLAKLKLFFQVARGPAGFVGAMRLGVSYILRNLVRGATINKRPSIERPQATQLIDVFQHYRNILPEDRGFGLNITARCVPERSITWVIPDFSANSGGHINISRMILNLQRLGYADQRVVITSPHRWSSAVEAEAQFRADFGLSGVSVSINGECIEPTMYLIATGWQTAYWVSGYRDCRFKLYFVQDFEPYFYSHGSDYFLSENTYRLGLVGITAGTWLSSKLAHDYGMQAYSLSFACDTDFYKPMRSSPRHHKNVFFYARPVTPRRCFEIGLLALKLVCDVRPDVRIIFAGWDVANYDIPFPHLNAGTVPLGDLPQLYSNCDAALILSGTNLSLLPLEVAACGCPIVMNDGENSKWLMPEDTVRYAAMGPRQLADAVLELLENESETAKRANAALEFSRSTSWMDEATKMHGFLQKIYQDKFSDALEAE